MKDEIRTVAGHPLHKVNPVKWNSPWDTDTFFFTYEGMEYECRLSEEWEHAEKPWSYRRTTGRAFVWNNPKVDDKILWDEANRLGLTTIYSEKGEYPTLDKAWKKYNRMEVKSMTGVLEAACKALGLTIESVKFSRFAGCSCPCSPGFIVKFQGIPGYFDLFVGEKKEPKVEPELEVPNRVNLVMED